MNSTDFTYWLQGFVELSESDAVPNEKQWLMIKDHLKLVFDKKTPDRTQTVEEKMAEYLKQPIRPFDFNKRADTNYWQQPVITCSTSDSTKINQLINSAVC